MIKETAKLIKALAGWLVVLFIIVLAVRAGWLLVEFAWHLI